MKRGDSIMNNQWKPDIIWSILLSWYLPFIRSHDDGSPGSDEEENLEWAIHRAFRLHDVPVCPYSGMDDKTWTKLARDALSETYGPKLTDDEKDFVGREISKIVDEVCRMRRG
jgi:hypothetical protein